MTENKNKISPNILSIEDVEKTVTGLFSELKLYYCANIDTAENMVSAQEALKRKKYDLILLDLRFPIHDEAIDDAGQQLILSLRRGHLTERNQYTPYLMVTAQDFSIPQLSERLDDDERSLVLNGQVGIVNKLSAVRSISDMVGRALGIARRDLSRNAGAGASQ